MHVVCKIVDKLVKKHHY